MPLAPGPHAELPPVVALAVHADNDAVQRVLPAQVQGRYSTPLSFRVGGKIVERRVRIGQQLDRDRAQAQANLIAPAQLEATQDAYTSALAQRDSALAQMGLAGDHLRYATLVADHDGAITSEDARTEQNVEPGQALFHLDLSGDLAFDGSTDAAADHTITLPATALFHRGEAPAVWVVRKGSDTQELRTVSIGRYDERTVSITSGLAGDERVVMQGVHTVTAGERVRVVPPLHPEDFPS
nr:hypothetical protein [Burkholderia ambifaria]